MSHEHFAIGEVAIIKMSAVAVVFWLDKYRGEEVVVISALGDHYGVCHADGTSFQAGLNTLCKKRPPREDHSLVRWQDCPWQPTKELIT